MTHRLHEYMPTMSPANKKGLDFHGHLNSFEAAAWLVPVLLLLQESLMGDCGKLAVFRSLSFSSSPFLPPFLTLAVPWRFPQATTYNPENETHWRFLAPRPLGKFRAVPLLSSSLIGGRFPAEPHVMFYDAQPEIFHLGICDRVWGLRGLRIRTSGPSWPGRLPSAQSLKRYCTILLKQAGHELPWTQTGAMSCPEAQAAVKQGLQQEKGPEAEGRVCSPE